MNEVKTKEQARLEQQAIKNRRNSEKKFLKEEVEMLELEYKYIQYMLQLPGLRQKFQDALDQQAKMAEESKLNGDKPEELTDLKPGTEVESKE